MDYSDLTKMTPEELAKVRVKLAKRANQRFVRLERSTSPVTGEAYHAGAYDIAQDYLRTTKGGTRFSESINYAKDDVYRLKRDILELDTFLHSKTSTVSGNKQIEKKRIETFTSDEYGLDAQTVSSKSFYDFLQSEAYDYVIKNSLTSEQIIDIYDTYRRNGATHEDIMCGIENYKNQIQKQNEESTTGKQITMSIAGMVSSLNATTGNNLKTIDVLYIKGD